MHSSIRPLVGEPARDGLIGRTGAIARPARNRAAETGRSGATLPELIQEMKESGLPLIMPLDLAIKNRSPNGPITTLARPAIAQHIRCDRHLSARNAGAWLLADA